MLNDGVQHVYLKQIFVLVLLNFIGKFFYKLCNDPFNEHGAVTKKCEILCV